MSWSPPLRATEVVGDGAPLDAARFLIRIKTARTQHPYLGSRQEGVELAGFEYFVTSKFSRG